MKYVVGVLGIILVTFLAISLLFRGQTKKAPQETVSVNLSEHINADSMVTYTKRGRINSLEEHRLVRISISQRERKVEILGGYSGNVLRSRTLSNTDEAYESFMHAIRRSGFVTSQKALLSDDLGVCPLGSVRVFELQSGLDSVSRLWSSSCSRKQGSLGGSAFLIERLFQAQIPEYRDFIRGVRF